MQNIVPIDAYIIVSTIAVVVLTVGVIVALVWMIKVLRVVNKIAEGVQTELDSLETFLGNQMKTAQPKIAAIALIAEGVVSLFGNSFRKQPTRRRNISAKRK